MDFFSSTLEKVKNNAEKIVNEGKHLLEEVDSNAESFLTPKKEKDTKNEDGDDDDVRDSFNADDDSYSQDDDRTDGANPSTTPAPSRNRGGIGLISSVLSSAGKTAGNIIFQDDEDDLYFRGNDEYHSNDDPGDDEVVWNDYSELKEEHKSNLKEMARLSKECSEKEEALKQMEKEIEMYKRRDQAAIEPLISMPNDPADAQAIIEEAERLAKQSYARAKKQFAASGDSNSVGSGDIISDDGAFESASSLRRKLDLNGNIDGTSSLSMSPEFLRALEMAKTTFVLEHQTHMSELKQQYENEIHALKIKHGIDIDVDDGEGENDIPPNSAKDTESETITDLKEELARALESNSALQDTLSHYQGRIERKEEEIHGLNNEIKNLEGLLTENNEKMDGNLADTAALQKENAALQEEIEEYNKALLNKVEAEEKLENNNRALQISIAELENQFNFKQEEVGGMKEKILESAKMNDQLEEVIAQLTTERTEIEGKLEQNLKIIEQKESELMSVVNELNEIKKNTLSDEAEAHVENIQQMKDMIEDYKNSLEEKDNALQNINDELTDTKDRLVKSTEDLNDYNVLKEREAVLECELAKLKEALLQNEQKTEETILQVTQDFETEKGTMIKELEGLNDKIFVLEAKIAEGNQLDDGLESTIKTLSSEVETLRMSLDSREAELEKEKCSNADEVAKLNNIIQDFEAKVENLNAIVDEKESQIAVSKDLEAQVEELNATIGEQENQIAASKSSENELEQLHSEKESIEAKLAEHVLTIEQKDVDLLNLTNAMDTLKKDFSSMKQDLDSEKESQLEEISNLQNAIAELESTNDKVKQELTMATEEIKELTSEKSAIECNLEAKYKSEIEQKEKALLDLSAEMESIKTKEDRDEAKDERLMLSKEIENLNDLITGFKSKVQEQKVMIDEKTNALTEAEAKLASVSQSTESNNTDKPPSPSSNIGNKNKKGKKKRKNKNKGANFQNNLNSNDSNNDELGRYKKLVQEKDAKIAKVLKEFNELTSKAEEARKSSAQVQTELDEVKAELQAKTNKLESYNPDELSKLQIETEEAASSLGNARKEIEDLKELLAAKDNEMCELQNNKEEGFLSEKSKLEDEIKTLQESLKKQSNILSVAEQDLESKSSKIEEILSEKSSLEDERKTLQESLEDKHDKLTVSEQELERKAGECEEIKSELSVIKNTLSERNEEVEALKAEVAEYQNNKLSLEEELQRYMSTLEEKEQLMNEGEAELEQLKEVLSNKESELKSLSASADEDIKEKEKEALEHQIETLKSSIETLENDLADTKEKLDQATAECTLLHSEKTAFVSKLEQLETENLELQEKFSDTEKELERIRDDLNQKDEEITGLKTQLEEESKVKNIDPTLIEELDAAKAQLEQSESTISSMTDLLQDYEKTASDKELRFRNLQSDFDESKSQFEQQMTAADDKVAELNADKQAMEEILEDYKSLSENQEKSLSVLQSEVDESNRQIALKDEELSALNKEIKKISSQVHKDYEKEIQKLSSAVRYSETLLAERDLELSTLRSKFSEMKSMTTTIRLENDKKLRDQEEHYQEKIDVLNLTHAKSMEEKLTEVKTEYEKKIEQRAKEIESIQKELSKTEEAALELREESESILKESEDKWSSKLNDEVKHISSEYEQKLALLESQLHKFKDAKPDMKELNLYKRKAQAVLKRTQKESQASIEALEKKLQSLKTDLSEKEIELGDQIKQYKSLEQQMLNDANANSDQVQETLNLVRSEVKEREARITSLEEEVQKLNSSNQALRDEVNATVMKLQSAETLYKNQAQELQHMKTELEAANAGATDQEQTLPEFNTPKRRNSTEVVEGDEGSELVHTIDIVPLEIDVSAPNSSSKLKKSPEPNPGNRKFLPGVGGRNTLSYKTPTSALLEEEATPLRSPLTLASRRESKGWGLSHKYQLFVLGYVAIMHMGMVKLFLQCNF